MKAGDVELSEVPRRYVEVVCWALVMTQASCLREDRPEEALWIDTSWYRMSAHLAFTGCSNRRKSAPTNDVEILTSVSVKRLGQNSRSSSKSNDRTASNFMRKLFWRGSLPQVLHATHATELLLGIL